MSVEERKIYTKVNKKRIETTRKAGRNFAFNPAELKIKDGGGWDMRCQIE